MRHTLKAVFDQRSDAQHVLDELLAAGYPQADTSISDEVEPAASLRHILERLFGGRHAAHGRHILTLTADSDPEALRARGIIERFGPSDIEDDAEAEPQAHWMNDGTPHTYPPGTAPGSLQHRPHDDSRYFGVQNADSPPIGNTFEESMGSTVRWNLPDEESVQGGIEAHGGTWADLDGDAYYRTHWNARYASEAHAGYEAHLPAYRYGSEARRNDAYRNRHWDQVEADLKAGWEAHHAGQASPWENFKDAVRHGWNRIDFDADTDRNTH